MTLLTLKPFVVMSACFSPFRSSSALVATVVLNRMYSVIRGITQLYCCRARSLAPKSRTDPTCVNLLLPTDLPARHNLEDPPDAFSWRIFVVVWVV